MPATRRAPAMIYELEMTLRESTPRIWRRLLVPGATTLHRLHEILQALMLWEDYHLYEFVVGDARYGIYELEVADEEPVTARRKLRAEPVYPAACATGKSRLALMRPSIAHAPA